MTWNWALPEWPDFDYDAGVLGKLEEHFIFKAGEAHGLFQILPTSDQHLIQIDSLAEEAVLTSAIEGDTLNSHSVQSSIRKHFGLSSDFRKVSPAEKGISEMMIELILTWNQPLSHESLWRWHRMLCTGRHDIESIGRYRSHEAPMQIVSGPYHDPIIHFEAPPSVAVKREMDRYIAWFNATNHILPSLTHASIAHYYFESIHPFEDGNGRIGRAIVLKSIAQSLGHPTLLGLSHVIAKRKSEYYQRFEQVNTTCSITPWITYFAQVIIDAMEYTKNQIAFTMQQLFFFQAYQELLNERQSKALRRIFMEGSEGFKGGLSLENYLRITKTSRATGTRDLQELVSMKALYKTGQLKGTRYFLNLYQERPPTQPPSSQTQT